VLDQLAEASFTATRQADAHFEARMNAARRLVDRSATVVDEAGERAAARMDASITGATAAMLTLQGQVDALGGRLERLPGETRGVSESLAKDVEMLVEAARRAAEETQAIDAAFQDRVRRNYETLSQAMRLMDDIAQRASAVAPVQPQDGTTGAGPRYWRHRTAWKRARRRGGFRGARRSAYP
jgi:hypothetical protein